MNCQTTNMMESEVRKRIKEHVKSIRKEQKRKAMSNSMVADDNLFEIINKNFTGKMVSKVIKVDRGFKRLTFPLNKTEQEDPGAYTNPRTETSTKSKYRKYGKSSKRNGKFYTNNQQNKHARTKAKESVVLEKDIVEVEKRRRSIRQKLLAFVNPVFTEDEECDINERADLYSSSMLPHEHYFLLQENVKEAGKKGSETMTESTDFVYSNHLVVQKKKRRSYSNIDRFVTHHSDDSYSDKTQILPEGTKLLKPPSKLVELVAQSIDGSPDGMLQVQQIYTVLQNKFPYFRYMDKAAISSWRSSVRHALYQKWFQKIKFNLESINSKGCFWSINYSLNPSEWAIAQSPACRLKNFCIPSVLPRLTNSDEEEQTAAIKSVSVSNTENAQVSENEDLKDVIQIAKEYGISFPESCLDVKGENLPDLNIPSPVKDPDPMLISCVPDWNPTPKPKADNLLDGCRLTADKPNVNCSSPYSCSSACEAFQTPPCSPSPTWEISQNEFYLFSPLSNCFSYGTNLFLEH